MRAGRRSRQLPALLDRVPPRYRSIRGGRPRLGHAVARHGGQLPDERGGDSVPNRVVGPCFSRRASVSVCDLQPRSAGVSGVTVRVAVVVAGLVVVATMAQGQRRIRGGRAVMVDRPAVGPRIGYDFDFDHVFVGGQLNLPVGRRWGLVPSAGVFPGQNGSPFRLNADLKYHPPTVYGLFYFGAGFAYLQDRKST